MRFEVKQNLPVSGKVLFDERNAAMTGSDKSFPGAKARAMHFQRRLWAPITHQFRPVAALHGQSCSKGGSPAFVYSLEHLRYAIHHIDPRRKYEANSVAFPSLKSLKTGSTFVHFHQTFAQKGRPVNIHSVGGSRPNRERHVIGVFPICEPLPQLFIPL